MRSVYEHTDIRPLVEPQENYGLCLAGGTGVP